jgi:hypothetical protein
MFTSLVGHGGVAQLWVRRMRVYATEIGSTGSARRKAPRSQPFLLVIVQERLASWGCPQNSKMSPCILLALPDDIAKSLLVGWIDLRDVASLDSAFCSAHVRERFCKVAYDKGSLYMISPKETRTKAKLRWIHLRGVQLHIVDYFLVLWDEEFREPVLRSTGANVHTVDVTLGPHTVITSSLFGDLAKWCPNVHTLYVETHGTALGSSVDDSLFGATKAMRQLTTLTVKQTPYLSAQMAKALGNCASLKHLAWAERNFTVPEGVAIPSLQTLDLECVVTDPVMLAIGKTCSQLTSLRVFWRSAFGGDVAARITDVGVRAVLQGCPLLREMDVEYAESICPELRVELTRRRNFTSLVFTIWKDINDELAREVLKVSPALSTITCMNCAWISDETIVLCAARCPLLKYVSLSNTGVGDDGVSALARHCTQLVSIDLTGCANVTVRSVRELAQHCSELKTFAAPRTLRKVVMPEFVAEGVQVGFR